MLKNFKMMTIAWGSTVLTLIVLGILVEVGYRAASEGYRENSLISSSSGSVPIAPFSNDAETSLATSKIRSADAAYDDENITILPPTTYIVPQQDDKLLEVSQIGSLPKRGDDGELAWQTYTSPVGANEAAPRIAIIITNMGLNKRQTTEVIEKMPPAVSFAYSPYSSDLNDWRNLSRSTGHEVLILLPMETVDPTQNDPGKLSLLATNDTSQNIRLLHTTMASMTGYVGMMNQMGSKFMSLQLSLHPILNEINSRGLIFVDSNSTPFSRASIIAQGIGLPRVSSDLVIDSTASEKAIRQQLALLESTAKSSGVAVGIAHTLPLSIHILEEWLQKIPDKGFQLVPITAVVNRQPIRIG